MIISANQMDQKHYMHLNDLAQSNVVFCLRTLAEQTCDGCKCNLTELTDLKTHVNCPHQSCAAVNPCHGGMAAGYGRCQTI